jgi:hypothetical protein
VVLYQKKSLLYFTIAVASRLRLKCYCILPGTGSRARTEDMARPSSTPRSVKFSVQDFGCHGPYLCPLSLEKTPYGRAQNCHSLPSPGPTLVVPCADNGAGCKPGMVAIRRVLDLPADIAIGTHTGEPRSVAARWSMLRSSRL